MPKKKTAIVQIRHHGDFDEIDSEYPECTQYVTSDVTLDVGAPAAQVNATIEYYGSTPNNQQRYLLTVWNSLNKPLPADIAIELGKVQIGIPVAKKAARKTSKKK